LIRRRLGTLTKKSRPMATRKLNPTILTAIRQRLRETGDSQTAIAAQFGVSQMTVSRIRRGALDAPGLPIERQATRVGQVCWLPHPYVTRAKFWDQVDRRDCWVWLGHRFESGHRLAGKPQTRLHGLGSRIPARVAWIQLVGPLPHGSGLRSICGNPMCIRPEHHALVRLGSWMPSPWGAALQRRRRSDQ
jgi:hypothetical protein